MTREEALQKARSLFGERAGISDGLQMKESLEPAVGVGFYEGADLCIHGKGTTWEKAIAHAETRRLKPVMPVDFIHVDLVLEKDELLERIKAKVQEKWGTIEK